MDKSTTKRGEDREPLGKIHEYVLRIGGSENIKELTKNTIKATEAMIQPDLIVFGTVHLGVLRGNNYRPQSGKMGTIIGGGMPLDGPGIIIRAIRTKKTCNVPDTRKDPDYFRSHVTPGSERVYASRIGEDHSLSEIAVPIITHGKAVGVLNIEDWDANAYTREDQEVLEALAGYAGLALGRIRYEERLMSIHSYASQLVSAQNVSEIADFTLDAMVNTLELELCEFSMVHDGIPTSVSVKGLDETMQLREIAQELSGDPRMVEPSDLEILSELEVSVMVGDDVVASLGARSIQPDTYTDQDNMLLETLASHVASAIQRIRLLEEQIQYETKLEALHQHAGDLTESTSIEMIAEYTIEVMHATLGMKSCDFYIREDQHLRLIKHRGWIPENPNQKFPLDGPGILVNTANTKKTILLSDIRKEPNYFEFGGTEVEGEEKYHPLSELCVPVISDDKVVAILNTESNRLDFYDERDQILLETLASHVASAIQRIRLLEAQIQYESKLEALHVHANKLADASNIEEIAVYSAEAANNIVKQDRGDWTGLGVVVGNSIEFGLIPSITNYLVPLDGPGVTIRTVNTGESQLINDIRKDIDYIGPLMDDNILLKLGDEVRNMQLASRKSGKRLSHSEVCVPVKIEDQVIGVLNAESLELNAFTLQDQKLLETLAGHVASAIQKIRLLDAKIQYETKLEALHLHTSRLADAISIEEISDYTIEAMETTLGFTWISMVIVEDNFFKEGIISRDGSRSKAESDLQHTDGIGIGPRAVRTGETQLVNDTRKDMDYVGTWMDDNKLSKLPENIRKIILHNREHGGGEWGSLSEIEVPVKIGQTVVALLGAESLELNAFTEQDKNLLETLANHVASALMRLKASEDRVRAQKNYQSILEGAADPITVTNKDSILYANKQAAELFGYNPSDMTGLLINDLLAPEHKQMVSDRAARRLLNQRVPNEYEVNIQRPDGTIIPTEFHLSVIEYQEELATLNFIRNISERKRTEARLSALHSMALELSYTESVEEIVETTFHIMREILEFPIFSFHLLENTGLVTVGTDGMPTLDMVFPLTGKGVTTRAAREARTILLGDVRLDPDYIQGSTHTRSELAVPILVENHVLGVLNVESTQLDSFTGDDTQLMEVLAQNVGSALSRLRGAEDRKELEREILVQQVQVEQEKELGLLKNQFISTATHELRTPVTSILGFLELVLNYSSQDLPDSVRKDLNVVFRNAMRLVELTNDLLDVQRITSGKFVVNLEQVDLMNMLNEVVEELSPLFAEKQQVLVVDAPSDLSVQVDEIRISQLFINLLRNANKFTPAEGNISLTVEPFERHVQISVKDSGIGLSEEDIGKLFKPFPAIRHGENVSSTGLGLAICKGIVDLHNGDIWVESDGLGKGCTFFVRIPVG